MVPLPVRRTIPVLILICTAWVLAPTAARAQTQELPPAYIAAVDGSVTVDRGGDVFPATVNVPLVTGDRVRTGTGRVEIRFADGSGIELAEDSEIEMLSPTRVRLLAGVTDRLEPQRIDRRDAQYLPPNLQNYGTTFEQYGSWQSEPQYGNVWYPRVAADWRPYYNGYWDDVPSYGWTWIGVDPWAWPTHHYGRWGYGRRGWFWIPGRTFAAAWVSWGLADSYVSWCPLGFDNRPVFALSVGFGDGWWRGWTVVRRDSFGYRGRYVDRFAVPGRDIPRHTAFVAQRTAPIAPRYSGGGTRRGWYGGGSYGTAAPRYGSREQVAPGRPAPAPRGAYSQAAPRYESPRYGSPRYESPRTAPDRAPRYESPRAAPQAMPRYESPRAAPRVMPRYESPRAAPQQLPRYESPRAMPERGLYPRQAPSATQRPAYPQASPRMAPSAPSAAPRAEPRAQPRSSSPSRDGGRSGSGERSGGRRRG